MFSLDKMPPIYGLLSGVSKPQLRIASLISDGKYSFLLVTIRYGDEREIANSLIEPRISTWKSASRQRLPDTTGAFDQLRALSNSAKHVGLRNRCDLSGKRDRPA